MLMSIRKQYLVENAFFAAKAFARNAILISSAFLTGDVSCILLGELFSDLTLSVFGKTAGVFLFSRFLALTTTIGFFSFFSFFAFISSKGLLILLPATSEQEWKEMARPAIAKTKRVFFTGSDLSPR